MYNGFNLVSISLIQVRVLDIPKDSNELPGYTYLILLIPSYAKAIRVKAVLNRIKIGSNVPYSNFTVI